MIKSFKKIPDKRCKCLDSPAYVLSITYYLGTFKSKVNGNFLASTLDSMLGWFIIFQLESLPCMLAVKR